MKTTVTVFLSIVLMTAACKKESREGELHIAIREPTSVDPAYLTGHNDFQVAANLHLGLFTWDPAEKAAVPELAVSHQCDEQHRIWVFSLDKEARYSDGSVVTARDFEFAWKRVLAPATASPGADALHIIKGGRDYAAGKGEQPAVEATDEHTLRVELENPQPFLPEILCSPRFAPLPERTFQDPGGELLEQEAPLFTGPFVVKELKERQEMVLERNPHFRWPADAGLERVVLHFTASEETALTWWDTGQVDMVTGLVPFQKIQYLKEKLGGQVVEARMKSVFYFVVNLEVEPTNSLEFRKALYAGIDREKLTDDVLAAGQQEAYSFIAPRYEDSLGFVPDNCPAVRPADARRGLSPELVDKAAGLELLSNASETLKTILEFSQQSIRQRVGLYLAIRLMEWKSFLALLKKGDFSVARLSLTGGADPVDFLDNFTTGHPNNFSRFSVEEYDAVVAQVHAAPAREERFRLTNIAHRMLCDNLPAVPVYYSSQVYLVRTGLLDRFEPDAEGIVRWQHLLSKEGMAR